PALGRQLACRARVPPARPDYARHARLQRRADVPLDHVRGREVDHRLGPAKLDQLVPCRLQRRGEHRTHLAPAPEEDDLHAALASPGLTCSTAARKRPSSGPIPAAESFSGASSTPASSANASASTASTSAMIRSIESSSVSG